MARLSQGDRDAFDPLYTALRPRALRLARHRAAGDDAPDVAQAALLRVFARASEFTPGRPCLPWFYSVVANELRTQERRRKRTVALAAVPEGVSPEADAESQLVNRELERALELAIDVLDDDAALTIRALLGRTPVPDVPGPTFRKRVSRAYAKLRLLLGGHDVG